ncbi:MAG: type II secretion system F family protein [Magnetococcales bacterium]|nr:type II secretion system F family protein [Magnetococcales bacterium]MBF0438671.1 type II secretion system F family protein [Magnetococcales bacterium]
MGATERIMAYFYYKRIGKDGVPDGGVVHLPFENPISAISYLEKGGGVAVFARPLPHWVGMVYGMLERFFETPVDVATMAEALNNVAIMLRSGISVLAAIQDAMADNENPTLSRIGYDLVRRIQAGSSLSEAAMVWKRFFPDTALFLMRIGEETGSLDRTILDASKHMLKVDKIRKETKSALMYPAIMFTAILSAMGFWLYFVVPMMLPMLMAFKKDLPALTVGIIATADFLRNHLVWIVLGGVGFVIVFNVLMEKFILFRLRVHELLLIIPIINKVIHASNLAFITEYFSLLLNAGVDVIKSIDILGGSLNNEVYKKKMLEVRVGLINGLGLRTSFADAKIFPPFVVRMIGIGEVSGALTTQLDYAAEEYARRLDDIVKTLSKSIEPIALVLGGGLFIVLLVGMFMPLYSMAG